MGRWAKTDRRMFLHSIKMCHELLLFETDNYHTICSQKLYYKFDTVHAASFKMRMGRVDPLGRWPANKPPDRSQMRNGPFRAELC